MKFESEGLRIKKEPGGLYSAEVFKFSPSLSWVKPEWATSKPMNTDDLIRELLALGFHQIDIGDAFYAADRGWLQQSLEMGRRPKPGDSVVLKGCPPGLLDALPNEDQRAISAIIGKPVRLNEYDDDGRAEVEFTDADGVIHFLFVSPDIITRA